MMVDPLRYHLSSGVAWIDLTAAEAGNPLSLSLLRQLQQALHRARSEPFCRAIVLSAEGSDFCRGLDLESFQTPQTSPGLVEADLLSSCLRDIRTCEVPVIAAVEGAVTGGGMGLVAACDIVLATRSATFMLPELVIGMVPALISPFLLLRLTPARLQYLAVSTRRIPAAEAKEFGLVDDLCEQQISAAVSAQLKRLFRTSPAAIATTKRYLADLNGAHFDQQLHLARETFVAWLDSPGVKDGIQAFAEGFSPPWFQRYPVQEGS